jgi:prepilin signal peptidase PulO-like enzyme (type II secretory pathway)
MVTTFVVIVVGLTVLGLAMGSFAAATVWRLRAKQLVADKKDGEKVDQAEFKQLKSLAKGTFGPKDHSHCLHCGYQLKWYDLIPLVSWIQLRGKCRNCHANIGWMEPLAELGTALFFVGSYLLWPEALTNPLAISHLVLWIGAGVFLAILFMYDVKWFLLPSVVNLVLVVIGAAVAVITVIQAANHWTALGSIVISAAILSGIYLVLYLVSKGRWIGFGDVKLGLALALLLTDWRLAAIALFAANLIGTLYVLPGLVRKTIKPQSRIPFGPLLILGAIFAQLCGPAIIDTYYWSLFV